MKNLFLIFIVLLCQKTHAQQGIFEAIERFDTVFVQNYLGNGGDIDAQKIEKVEQSSFKLKRTKYGANLFEKAIGAIRDSEAESNPSKKIKAYRNFYLLLEKVNLSKNKEHLLSRVFTFSISLGDIDLIRKIYLSGANINYRCQLCYGRTPLLIALGYNQNFEVIKFLLSLKPDLTITDFDEKNALHYSAQQGNYDLVKYLLQNKLIDINSRDKRGNTAVTYAAIEGDYLIFNYLVENGADLTVTSSKGLSVLHLAAQTGDVDFFRHVHYVSQMPLWNMQFKKRDVYQYTSVEEPTSEAIRLYIVRYTIKEFGWKYYKKRKRTMRFKNIFFPTRFLY